MRETLKGAPVMSTYPAAGVMHTRPATAPLIMPSTDGFLRTTHSVSIHVSAAMDVAICG